MQRFQIERDDVILSGLRGGAGTHLVVLLHGLAGAAQEMVPTAQALAGDYRVIALDLRGHGHSTRVPADLSRQAFVDDVLAVLDEPAVLVGQSMGAQTAMLAAAAAPAGRVRGLVMLEGGVGGSEDDYPTRLGNWFRSWPVPFPDRGAAVAYLDGTPTAEAWAADLEARPDGLWPRFDPEVMEATIRAVADEARWPQWQAITAPTLLVTGDRGYADPKELERMLALRPDVGHEVIADAGHDAHLDQPAQWQRILRAFLTGLP